MHPSSWFYFDDRRAENPAPPSKIIGRCRVFPGPTLDDGRGRHTTTRRELLFCAEGGMVIDTPGMRELQLWDDDEGLQITFDEIETIARNCRYHDCRHQSEPGCAVIAAVESGALDANRLSSFHKLQRELARLNRREEPRADLEEKRRWKNIHKSARRFMQTSSKYK